MLTVDNTHLFSLTNLQIQIVVENYFYYYIK